jgi:hypothetical protein
VANGLWIVFFGGWLLATLLCQKRGSKISRAIRSCDPLGMVPTWTFFAPSPGRHDYRLFYRDQQIDGGLSPWREIDDRPARKLRAVWNPEKRLRKTLSDTCSAVLRLPTKVRSKPDRAVLHPAYLFILARVMRFGPKSPLNSMRQFAIVQTAGFAPQFSEAYVRFLSAFHRFGEDD